MSSTMRRWWQKSKATFSIDEMDERFAALLVERDALTTENAALRERLADLEQNWHKHPRAQLEIGLKARLRLQLRHIEEIVGGTARDELGIDDDYWSDLCDATLALRQRLAEAEKLAYIGDHHHPDLTYKARLDELVPQHRALEARLAEAERNEGTLLDMIRHQRDVLRECLPYLNESMAGRRPGRSADDIRAAVNALTTDSASAVELQPGAPRFDGAAAYERYLDSSTTCNHVFGRDLAGNCMTCGMTAAAIDRATVTVTASQEGK